MRHRTEIMGMLGLTLWLCTPVMGGPQDKSEPLKSVPVGVQSPDHRGGGDKLRQVAQTTKGAKTGHLMQYRPPKRGAPSPDLRQGGASRGSMQEPIVLEVLAPDNHIGLTSQAAPDLYWFISEPTEMPTVFTLIYEHEGIEPLIEVTLPSPLESGVHRIPLGDFNFELEKGKTYRWSVSLIADPDSPSGDIVAGGVIAYEDFPDSLDAKGNTSDPLSTTGLYAQAGFWYDAITAISRGIAAFPDNQSLREARASLLQQVRLSDVAESDSMKKT